MEHATHEEFQTWIASNGIPVNDKGIAAWSFDDRCAVINYARSKGAQLRLVSDLFRDGESASQAG